MRHLRARAMLRRRTNLRWYLLSAFSLSFFFLSTSALAQNPPAKSAEGNSSKTSDSQAKPDYSRENFIIESFSSDVTFATDGTGRQEQTVRVHVLSQAGVQAFGVLSFPYASENERVDIDYIRVTKANGAVTVTPVSGANDITSEVSRVAPMYSDSREKQVPVKALGPGDTLEWRIRKIIVKPQGPGQFWFTQELFQSGVVLQETLRVTVPAAKYVAVKASHATDLTPEITEHDGLRTYFWKTAQLKPTKQKQQSADDDNSGDDQADAKQPPAIHVTTFRNWEEVGHWYEALQKSQLEVTPALRAKAAELIKGAATDQAKLEAIYRYVATEFRYISVSFGQGRYQPHSADEVLSNQYGDCKDKHTLFATLLKAAGIDAWPALIAAGTKLDPDIPSPAQFNHVITYVPNHGAPIWLDTTPGVAPFGMLQQELRDQQALVIPSNSEKSALMTTPADLPFPADEKVSMLSKLSPDGTLTGHFDLTARGDSELILKSVFHQVPPANWTTVAQNISMALGYAGTISNLDVDDPSNTVAPFHYSYDYERKTFSDWENRRIMPALPPMSLPHSTDQDKPKDSIYIGAKGQMLYQAKMDLPDGYTLELPSDTVEKAAFAEYRASYSVKDRVFVVERQLTLKNSKVTLDQWSQYQSFTKAMNADQLRFIQLVHSESASEARVVRDNPEAADLVSKAVESLQSRDLNAARDALAQAERLNPEQAGLWAAYATLYGQESRNQDAVTAIQKEIEFHPGNESMYRFLAAMQQYMGRRDDAIDTLRKLVKMSPGDTDSLMKLGAMLIADKNYSEAADRLQTALKADPDNTTIGLRLAEALLRGGKKAEGEALLTSMRSRLTDASSLNDAGYFLADTDTDAPLAKELSQKAVADAEEKSKDLTLSSLTNDDLRRVNSLGAAWDTLGWAYYRAGDLAGAEKYINAAWLLLEHPAAADHLGQIYEKQGKREAAVHAYELALAVQPDMPATRERLDKLRGPQVTILRRGGGAKPANPGPIAPAEELGRLRSTPLPKLTQKKGSAEVFILFSPAKVLDVNFIRGDDTLKAALDAISQARFDKVVFPDDGPERIARRGILSCSPYTTPSCSVVFLLPSNTTK